MNDIITTFEVQCSCACDYGIIAYLDINMGNCNAKKCLSWSDGLKLCKMQLRDHGECTFVKRAMGRKHA